jgi:KAP family P-loop domain
VEAAKDNALKFGVATVYFYCDPAQYDMLNGSALLASFIKQVLIYFRKTKKPWPPKVREDIEKFFGKKRIEPDLDDLDYIFSSLHECLTKAIYVIDGLDELSEKEVENILQIVRRLFGSKSEQRGSRIIIFSRDQVALYLDITRAIPGTVRISTSDGIENDIQKYIDTEIENKTVYVRQLTSDPVLMEETKAKLSQGASGMYVLLLRDLSIPY